MSLFDVAVVQCTSVVQCTNLLRFVVCMEMEKVHTNKSVYIYHLCLLMFICFPSRPIARALKQQFDLHVQYCAYMIPPIQPSHKGVRIKHGAGRTTFLLVSKIRTQSWTQSDM